MAVTFDLRKSFLQCALSDEVRPYFAYRSMGRWYRLAALPMGANFAPALMHNITSVIADVNIPGVKAEIFVDNVRFHGPKTAVMEAARQFRFRASKANATLNEESQNRT